jgi:ribosome-associated protein
MWRPGKLLLMVSIQIQTETIRLSQLLKLANVVQDGSEAKFRIFNEEVAVNGEVEIRRGRKLRNGDQVEFDGETYEVVAINSTR